MKNFRLFILVVVGTLLIFSFKSNKATIDSVAGLEVGSKIPNINTACIEGTPFDLSKLKGKMVLVNFWASYDANSRVENFQTSNLIKKFKTEQFTNGNGLAVVNISFDRFKAPLKQAIERDDLSQAINICDFKGVDSDIAQAFSTTEPTQFLVDGNGFIIAKTNNTNDIATLLEHSAIH